MVTLSHIASASGVGDTLDNMFTVDSELQHTFLIISSHDGQADSITGTTIDGSSLSPLTSHGDGTTTHVVYDVQGLAAGSHDLTIVTGGGTFRYGFTLIKVLGWTGVYTLSQTTGVGTSISNTIETRTPDNVISILTANTTVTATSGDTLLQSGTAGTGTSRIRFATSYDTSGAISWTLATAQAWAMTLIRLRGTAFAVGTPTASGTPIAFGTPIRVGVPGSVLLNPPA